jgi:hypothetical protein
MNTISAPRRIAQTICPHSFREVVSLARDIPLRFEVNQREREIVSGDADDITDEYQYQTVSRIRSRLQRLEDDIEALGAHGDLGDELREIVCDIEDGGEDD